MPVAKLAYPMAPPPQRVLAASASLVVTSTGQKVLANVTGTGNLKTVSLRVGTALSGGSMDFEIVVDGTTTFSFGVVGSVSFQSLFGDSANSSLGTAGHVFKIHPNIRFNSSLVVRVNVTVASAVGSFDAVALYGLDI